MIKKVFSLAMTLMCVMLMSAQSPLPLNPKVRTGVLPNGLTYYVLHNEEPKERANFYIAQKVGSTLENADQLGLAHFLEHMAFNGTENFPGKNMLEYLQANGIRFGADINAYTSFDETVYNINNIPTTNQALMDSVLLMLHDWSGSLQLLDDEINAERKVIQEEWRMRDSAGQRFFTALLKNIYQEPQYQQMPIGTMDVVMNFQPDALRAYYKKWYRPDQQGIVVVGDFDAEAMEQKIISIFSEIPMLANAAQRTYPAVSDNAEPIYFEFDDPEMPQTQASLAWKFEKTPWEMRNTVEAYLQDFILFRIVANMINERLGDAAQDPACPYSSAYVDFGDYFISKTKGAFNLTVGAKEDVKTAVQAALAIVMQAVKGGFNQTELERANADFLATLEKQYNERDKTNTEVLAREIIRHFVDNEPDPGIEQEYQLAQMVIPSIPLEAYNSLFTELQFPSAANLTVAIVQPRDAAHSLPGKDAMLAIVNEAMNAQYEAMVEEAITEPLIEKLPAKGSIVSVNENGPFGSTEIMLSNGVKVIVKPTDFASDEILFSAVAPGGKKTLAESQAANVVFVDYDIVKFNNFDSKTLSKYLAGKNVNIQYEINNNSISVDGSSNNKDLPTLMELVYTAFTNLKPDPTSFDAARSSVRPIIANMEQTNPDYIFQRDMMMTVYGNNPLAATRIPSLAEIDAANYDSIFALITEPVKNAANYTFTFTGNVDVNTLKPLLEQYVATLPSTGKADEVKLASPVISVVKGKVDRIYDTKMVNPSTYLVDVYSGDNKPAGIETMETIDLVGDILSNLYTRVIREEHGGDYSPYAYAQYNAYTNTWAVNSVIQTNAEQQDEMAVEGNRLFNELLQNGASEEDFQKVRLAAINQLENNSKTNAYWKSSLTSYILGFDTVTNAMETLQNMTLDKFNAWMKDLYNGQNRVQIVRTGVPME